MHCCNTPHTSCVRIKSCFKKCIQKKTNLWKTRRNYIDFQPTDERIRGDLQLKNSGSLQLFADLNGVDVVVRMARCDLCYSTLSRFTWPLKNQAALATKIKAPKPLRVTTSRVETYFGELYQSLFLFVSTE